MPSFISTLLSFLWNATGYDFRLGGREDRRSFLHRITEQVVTEPLVPVNWSCGPPRLPGCGEVECAKWPEGLTGRKLDRVPRIGVLLQFGFEADVLEVHLNELDPVVDKFFLIEETVSHAFNDPKPLVWERIRHQARFRKFLDKVVYFVLDDSYFPGHPTNTYEQSWGNEHLQEQMRWILFQKWNHETKFFGDDDIVGFGDCDEIPSIEQLNLLRYCEIKEPSVDIGTWFTFFADRRYKVYAPVPGHAYHLGDPTYWKLKTAKHASPYPSRMRGKSGNYLVGGLHLTEYQFLPSWIIKRLTLTEFHREDLVREVVELAERGKSAHELQWHVTDWHRRNWGGRKFHRLPAEDLDTADWRLPWFLRCNPTRYPTFYYERPYDPRLG